MATPHQDIDVLILGQGLAGSTLAWRLIERGLSVMVVDRGGVDEAGRASASRVAAGLITPVIGKRMTIAADFEAQWQAARDFYRQVEKQTDVAILEEAPAVRIFKDSGEVLRFHDRDPKPYARLATPAEMPIGLLQDRQELGAFVMPGAARLDTAAYLNATHDWLTADGNFIRGELDLDADLNLTAAGVAVPRLGITTRRLILCQGHTPTTPRWLGDQAFTPAKGEVLTVDSPTLQDRRVIHRGIWIVPDESGIAGRYRVGSTYDWDCLDSDPTEAARDELLARLAEAGLLDVRVVGHEAAVRPATSDRQPVLGFSPDDPRIGWLNGLGAKGSLLAPTYAERMAEFVADSLNK